METELRLDKYLRTAGVATRSELRRMVSAGRVTVNGVPARSAADHCAPTDDVRVDGRRIEYAEHVYLLLHKPAGCISATDSRSKTTVLDLIGPEWAHRKLFPVGRLDEASEGLLLLTDDGDLCHRVISPRCGIVKEYYVELSRPLPADAPARFREGIVLDGGERCLPAEVEPSADGLSALVRIREGKYHQVRRMALALGSRVTYLRRTAEGPLRLDPALQPGEYRELTADELARLRAACDREDWICPDTADKS